MQVRMFVEPQQGATYDDLVAAAKVAEECGFDGFFRSDHYLTMGGDGLPGPTDAWISLAGIARETTRIKLGTLVTPVTFRLPGPLAIMVSQVDAMSQGRVELGLGAGWYDDEHVAYGVPFPPMRTRFDHLSEQFEILTGIWSTPVGEMFNHKGKHYELTTCPALPKPIQHPYPRLIVGGIGPKRIPKLAARFGNEYNTPFMSAEDAGGQFAKVAQACEAIGRDPKDMGFSSAVVVCCGRDEAEIDRRAKAIGRKVDELRSNGAAGTPSEVIETCEAYRCQGAGTIYLQILDLSDMDHVRLIGDEVIRNLD